MTEFLPPINVFVWEDIDDRTAKQEVVEVIAVGPQKTIYEETLRLLLREK